MFCVWRQAFSAVFGLCVLLVNACKDAPNVNVPAMCVAVVYAPIALLHLCSWLKCAVSGVSAQLGSGLQNLGVEMGSGGSRLAESERGVLF